MTFWDWKFQGFVLSLTTSLHRFLGVISKLAHQKQLTNSHLLTRLASSHCPSFSVSSHLSSGNCSGKKALNSFWLLSFSHTAPPTHWETLWTLFQNMPRTHYFLPFPLQWPSLKLSSVYENASPFSMQVHAKSLSHVRLFATLWTIAHQAPLSMGILQARILEWVAMGSSRGSSLPRNRTRISCLLLWQMGSLPLVPLGKPFSMYKPVGSFTDTGHSESGSDFPSH